MTRQLLVIVVISILSGCGGTAYQNVKKEPEFTLGNLNSGGLAVIGTVSTNSRLNEVQRYNYGTKLYTTLSKEHPAIEMLSPGSVAEKIGKNEIGKILDEYRVTSYIPKEDVEKLRKALPVRYIVISRIDGNSVENSYDSYKDKEEKRHFTLYTKRNINTDISVFDLQGGLPIWKGTSKRTFTKREYVTEAALSQKSLLGLVESYMTNAKLEKLYPKPYTTGEALERLYAWFAKDLPEHTKSN